VTVHFPLLISVGKERLHAVCHIPEIKRAPFPVVLFFHGLGGNKVGSFRCLANLADKLTSYGIATVRFDFRGHGDSDGTFSSATLHRCIEDAFSVYEWVKSYPFFATSCLGFFGRSFGGLLSIIMARMCHVRVVVVHAPPFSIDPYLQPAHPSHLEERDHRLFFYGEPLALSFLDELKAVHMQEKVEAIGDIPFLHISGGKDLVVNHDHTDKYREARKNATAPSCFIELPNADHACSLFSDRQKLLHESTEWFISHLL